MLVGFQHEQALWRCQSADSLNQLFHVGPAFGVEQVWWRAENDPGIAVGESLVGRHAMLDPVEGVGPDDFDLFIEFQRGYIFFDQSNGWKMLFYQDCLLSTSAHCFQADCPGAGEEVDHQAFFIAGPTRLKAASRTRSFIGRVRLSPLY